MTDKNWYSGSPQPSNKNGSIERCCGSCKMFEHEGSYGEGICSESDSLVMCGDYCGDWEKRNK